MISQNAVLFYKHKLITGIIQLKSIISTFPSNSLFGSMFLKIRKEAVFRNTLRRFLTFDWVPILSIYIIFPFSKFFLGEL